MFRSSPFVLSAVIVLGLSAAGRAQPLFTDGFETYAPGALDKNLGSGPNAAPNGSGNPWFGPAPPNLQVVPSGDGGVTAHGGNQMVRGTIANDKDQNWYNLAYRLNGGNPYTGNVVMSFWFFDPLGAGGTAFQDYGALGFYNTAPGTTDYPGTGSLNTGLSQIQRLSLGASSVQDGTFDPTRYQARIVGATDGYDAAGWFNTNTPRTVGWHQGMIVIGPSLGDGTNDVNFYIDNLATPTLTHNSVTAFGYNVLELNADQGPTTGYFDDVSFSAVPEPSSLGLLAVGLAVAWRRGRAAGRTRPS